MFKLGHVVVDVEPRLFDSVIVQAKACGLPTSFRLDHDRIDEPRFNARRQAKLFPALRSLPTNNRSATISRFPIEEELGGFLPIPDAEDNVLAILATEGLDETGERSHFTTASFGLNHGLSERMTIGGNVQAGYRSGVSVVLTLHCPRRLHQR